MPVNATAFLSAITAFQEAMVTDVAAHHKEIALDAARHLVEYTPVESGNARFNWVLTGGRPFKGELPYNKDQVIWDRKDTAPLLDVGGLAPVARAANDLRKITDPVIYITNNVPYIERLENNYSSQSGNMLALTVSYLLAKYPDLVNGSSDDA